MTEQLLSQFSAMSGWEYAGVAFGFLYLIFAIMQNSLCWPMAFISTMIYTVLFWQGKLLLESLLNVYYLIMAVYGWYQWRGGVVETKQKLVTRWSLMRHISIISTLTIVTVIIGFYADEYTQAKYAYLDSFTTVFAIFTTYMVTQKVLENWLYWIVIDLASIYLYVQNGYLPTAALFVIYTVLAFQGYREWQADYIEHLNDKEEADELAELGLSDLAEHEKLSNRS